MPLEQTNTWNLFFGSRVEKYWNAFNQKTKISLSMHKFKTILTNTGIIWSDHPHHLTIIAKFRSQKWSLIWKQIFFIFTFYFWFLLVLHCWFLFTDSFIYLLFIHIYSNPVFFNPIWVKASFFHWKNPTAHHQLKTWKILF